MNLRTIFAKPVDRKIEGVIKADDESGLRNELEEYVLTNEVAKRLESFLDAYNNYSGANGVWISGFFGSGKSHLLKMLAYLLENGQVDGKQALELFISKCGNNEILRADLERAVSIPSKSILFNIDQKADVISKKEVDALLAVFVKVFDDMCGYCGKLGHIAKLERDLDQEGLLAEFRKVYEELAGRSWESGRERPLIQGKNIAEAYQKVSNCPTETANGIVNKYRAEYSLSIEDFAEQINAYIKKQEADFRLNFFVDEVGQYIAENTKLMTNLQTVAESLATHCHGRAWVIVTAQEDMSTVMGEMDKKQGNDFSKIQARFSNRMKLTSTDVSEVIQKRLLLKNEAGIEQLEQIHRNQVNNFKTLFDFADGSYSYRNFRDRDNFIQCYPFIPYQFDLFQSAIQNLSLHNAFEGQHSSVGERSMLGVFQEVVIQVSNQDVGTLATFDLMFKGISTALKAQVQKAVLAAEKDLDNQFAIRVLKALFLVKYVKEFKATVRNICVLMHGSFDIRLPKLREDVEEALNLLEQQTYIQRNGECYEFLTDEEKDIEEEIKHTKFDTDDVYKILDEIIYSSVIKDRKIRHGEYKIDYAYSRKIDDRLYGREQELTLHISTPLNENSGQLEVLNAQSMGRNELLIVMPEDDRLIRDLYMYIQTEKYVGHKTQNSQQDSVKRILIDKRLQNQERRTELNQRVQALLGQAKLFIQATELEIGGEDAQTRVIRGFHELINRTYTNLKMLKGINYQEKDLSGILTASNDSLFENDAVSMSEAEQDIFAFIQSKKREGIRTTVTTLLNRFEHKPYGWPYAAVLCILAKVIVRGKVDVTQDSNLLEGKDLLKVMVNSQTQSQLILEPQIDFSASQIRALKSFYGEYFNQPPRATEAKALAQESATAFSTLTTELQSYLQQKNHYAFLAQLVDIVPELRKIAGNNYTFFLQDLRKQENKLFEVKEDIIDPICSFMNGQLRKVYDSATDYLNTNRTNLSYLESDVAESIKAILQDATCYKGKKIQKLKALLDELKSQMEELLKAQYSKTAQTIHSLQQSLRSMDEYKKLDEEQQSKLCAPFNSISERLLNEKIIAVIRDQIRIFEDDSYQKLLSEMCLLANPPVQEPVKPASSSGGMEVKETEVVVECVQSRNLRVPFSKAQLCTESDVDNYLSAMKDAMMQQINTGKRVQI